MTEAEAIKEFKLYLKELDNEFLNFKFEPHRKHYITKMKGAWDLFDRLFPGENYGLMADLCPNMAKWLQG